MLTILKVFSETTSVLNSYQNKISVSTQWSSERVGHVKFTFRITQMKRTWELTFVKLTWNKLNIYYSYFDMCRIDVHVYNCVLIGIDISPCVVQLMTYPITVSLFSEYVSSFFCLFVVFVYFFPCILIGKHRAFSLAVTCNFRPYHKIWWASVKPNW